MFSFDSLTCVTKGNILNNIPLHSVPPISYLEIMILLIHSWINGISGPVILMKYLILQFLDVRHTYPSFVPQNPLVVFRKPERLLFLDITLHFLDLLIFQLTSMNILK
jgi:hypothetical protein